MTSDQIARVRESWTLVVPIAETAAAHFYERLFALDPSLRRLFVHGDAVAQRRKLVQALAVMVAGIDDFERVLPAAEALGRRHEEYGVEAAHYATVGDALLWTLAHALGDAFDDETREAWALAYGAIASAMQGAAASPVVPPARRLA